MVNYNPETVSTDYDVCDRLYFEEISFEVGLLAFFFTHFFMTHSPFVLLPLMFLNIWLSMK
jgi:hypothetical protein